MNKKKSKYLNRWLADRYGSSRGFLLTYKYRAFAYAGRYKKYKKIDWDKIERLVFICKGNICRSAFAESVARTLQIETISCGIDTHDGKPANESAVRVAAEKGFNMEEHKTRKISSIGLKKTDLFIAMEPKQIKYLEDAIGDEYAYTLMGLWGSPILPYIKDPYNASNSYFNNCFDYIERTVCSIQQMLNNNKRD